jgi:hypothetical protein
MRSATTLNGYMFATKLGLKNTVTSSLANVSNGGTEQVLETNLNTYGSFMANQSYFGRCNIKFNVSETSPYQSGIWQAWDTNGVGVSSAYANYTLTFASTESDMQLEHETNITTQLNLDGNYSLLGGTEKQVNLTCEILNENEPALANNIDVYFDFDGDTQTQDWVAADSPTVTDYGNGTYIIEFIADTQTRTAAMHVSAQVNDTRNIFVMANVTCIEN